MSSFPSSVTNGRDLRSLRYVEHFLCWALRTSVGCSPHCRMLLREFAHAFGPEPSEGMKAFHDWLQALARGRRRLEIGRPGLIQLTGDEELILSLLASAQAADAPLFAARARFVMGAEPQSALYGAACTLMRLLEQRGYSLPERSPPERSLPDIAPCTDMKPRLVRGHAAL